MISVVVPAYNSEGTIGKCLLALIKQNYTKKYEIIVVDDGSTDKTVDEVCKFKEVRLLKQKHKGPAAARNFGVRHAKGDIVLFTDSDCVPNHNWIRDMVKPFEKKDIVGVSGAYKTLNKDKLIARFVGFEIAERHNKLKEQKEIDFIGTYSAGYRKNIFLKFGGFDEKFPLASGEDPELSFKISRANLRMIFQPNAFVYHRHPETLWKFLKKKFWTGFWRVFIYKKHRNKIFRHSYTPKSLYLEEAIAGLTFALLLFGLLNIIPLIYGASTLILSFLLTIPFSLKVFFKDKMVGIFSPFIILLRNFFTGFGIVLGIINLIKK